MNVSERIDTILNLSELTRKGHCQTSEHWSCFKGDVGKPKKQGGVHMGFSERIDAILNYTDLN